MWRADAKLTKTFVEKIWPGSPHTSEIATIAEKFSIKTLEVSTELRKGNDEKEREYKLLLVPVFFQDVQEKLNKLMSAVHFHPEKGNGARIACTFEGHPRVKDCKFEIDEDFEKSFSLNVHLGNFFNLTHLDFGFALGIEEEGREFTFKPSIGIELYGKLNFKGWKTADFNVEIVGNISAKCLALSFLSSFCLI